VKLVLKTYLVNKRIGEDVVVRRKLREREALLLWGSSFGRHCNLNYCCCSSCDLV
jgi:hypothetical protein